MMNVDTKIAIILRAVPGSGKSTFCSLVKEYVKDLDISVDVFSTDNKFVTSDGKYDFDATKLGAYHIENLEDFKSALGKTNVVICDNTNIGHRDYRPYASSAKAKGYKVVAVVFSPDTADVHYSRNVHDVPMATIEKMINRLSLNMDSKGVDEQFEVNPRDGAPDSLYSSCIIKAIFS